MAHTGISLPLAALIAEVAPLDRAVDQHQRDVLDQPGFAALDLATRARETQHNNDLNETWIAAADAVTLFPAATAVDLRAKLAFIAKNRLHEGKDWLPTILADLSRIIGGEA